MKKVTALLNARFKKEYGDRLVPVSIRRDSEGNKDVKPAKWKLGEQYTNFTKNSIAMRTGEGIGVVDVDTKDLSKLDPYWKKWVKDRLKKKDTLIVETYNGYHIYLATVSFKMKSTTKKGKDKSEIPFIDFRGEGGLIFVASTADKVSYKVISNTKPYVPKKDLFDKLPRKSEKKVETVEREEVGKTDLDNIQNALGRVDIMEYRDEESWFHMLASIYHGGGAKAEDIAREWSKGDVKKYDRVSFDKKWDRLLSGDFGEDIDIRHLLKESKGDDPTDSFKKENGTVHNLSPKQKKKSEKKAAKKKNKADKKFSLLRLPNQLNDKVIREQSDQITLFPNVLTKGMHSFIFGAAGANKTTVSAWLIMDVLKRFPNMICHFWSFDTSRNHEQSIYNYAKKQNIHDDKLLMSTASTSEDYYEYYDTAIRMKMDLSNVIVVIDTFKFITTNIQDKNANKKALHYIKELTNLGATAISLGHTNKDGEKQSGTAEIEQDSEALLRIDRNVNHSTQEVTLTISKAGRCRFACEGVTFKSNPKGGGYNYLYTALKSMKVMDKVVDLASTAEASISEAKRESKRKDRLEDQKSKDHQNIKLIKECILDLDIPYTQAIKDRMYEEYGINRKVTQRLLPLYNANEWMMQSVNGKNKKMYKLMKKDK